MKSTTPHHGFDNLQARLAARLIIALNAQAAVLPHDVSERLRVAREEAVVRARDGRRKAPRTAASAVGLSGVRVAILGGGPAWWQRMASLLPLLVLVAGLVLISERAAREQVVAAADIDAVLLADDLPPDAYTDPGFAEYLKTPEP